MELPEVAGGVSRSVKVFFLFFVAVRFSGSLTLLLFCGRCGKKGTIKFPKGFCCPWKIYRNSWWFKLQNGPPSRRNLTR